MKIRLHNNAIRVRLSQSEVERLRKTGQIEGKLSFPAGEALSYALEIGPDLGASFEDHRINITLPNVEARRWLASNETGIGGSIGNLSILVERDFQCLHGSEEDNKDTFPNPMTAPARH